MTGPEGTTRPGAQRAESYLRLCAEQELGEAVAEAQTLATARDEGSIAIAREHRVTALAGALAALGAVHESTAMGVLADLNAALVQSGLRPAREADAAPEPGLAPPPDVLRAFPAGGAVECKSDYFAFPLHVRLSALVTDGQPARLTYRLAYTDPQLSGRDAYLAGPDPWDAFRGSTAADDRGGQYDVSIGVAGGGHRKAGAGMSFRWEGWLGLNPAPPDEARWLEVTIAGQAGVRIGLERVREPAVSTAVLDPAGAADRYLDARSVTLLTSDPELRGPNRSRSADVVAMAADLLDAGVLEPASPSLARLAAVAARQGVPLPGPLAAIGPAALPADWARVAARAGQGASGVVFPAAVFPAVGGVRCVITELASRPDITTLRVYAPAWPLTEHPSGTGLLYGSAQYDDRYHWHARDDLGNGYALTAYRGVCGITGAEFPLRLHPPVSPQARELEVTLAGRTEQASARIPLDWQADGWDSDAPDWQEES